MKQVLIKENRATTRMGYLPIGGGGLNASYTTVDAIANICTTAGNLGMKYGKDFIWAYQGYDDDDDDCVTLMVKEEKYETRNFLLVGLCLALVFVSFSVSRICF